MQWAAPVSGRRYSMREIAAEARRSCLRKMKHIICIKQYKKLH